MATYNFGYIKPVVMSKLVAGVPTAIDSDNPLPISGTIAVTVGEVEVKNDSGNPIPMTTAAAGAGAVVTATTPRVTLASDDPAVIALQIMDDWDETNRAAVNLIAGQVGVAGGTGTDAATVLRVSLATNVALPAGTNGIGKLTANSGVDIGDVDVLTVPADPFGANADAAVAAGAAGSIQAKLRLMTTQLDDILTEAEAIAGYTETISFSTKLEDAASANADRGIPSMAIQKATPANLAGADGDYEMLQMSAGRLWVSSILTDVVPGTAATNLGKAEDAVHASGDVGVQILAVQKATPVNLAGTDGDYEPLQISGGRLWVSAADQTDTIRNGATDLTPKFAFANVAASATDSNIVSAVASKKIRVLAVKTQAGGTATNITFNSKPGGAGTAKTALAANAANGGFVMPYNPLGWFETVSGEGLTVTTGAGSTTGVDVVYVEI